MANSPLFDLPFTKASKYFAKKIPMTKAEQAALEGWAKKYGFTVANVTKAEIIQDIMDAQRAAIDEGITLADFNAALADVMDVRGWTGTTPWHADNILRTNTLQAYGTGRLKQAQAQAEDFPYWLFVAGAEACPICGDLNGTVFVIGDVIWWPPIHFQCECTGESLTAAEAEELGGADDGSDLPDPAGFDGPGSDSGDEYTPDLSNLDDALATIVQDVLDGFDPNNVED